MVLLRNNIDNRQFLSLNCIETIFQIAQRQTVEYMDKSGALKSYLIAFDRNKAKS